MSMTGATPPSVKVEPAARLQQVTFAIAKPRAGLTDRELHDIGISHGEIDYVASNRSIDPRGV